MKAKRKPKKIRTTLVLVELSSHPWKVGHSVYRYDGEAPPISAFAISHSKSTDSLLRCAARLKATSKPHSISPD